MRIAVIVPALDEHARLGAQLGRLRRRADVDDIVVVDASRTTAACAWYANSARPADEATHYIGAPRAGRAGQMNIGADAIDADVYVFLHSDSTLPDIDLRRHLAAAMPRPGWGRFDIRFDADRWWARMIAAAMNRRSRLTGIATGDQAIFIGRDAWHACGGYRDMPLMEDIDISRRLKRRARPACLRAAVTTSARRWQRHGVWRTIALMWRLRLLYWFGVEPARLARMYRDAR